MKVLILVVFKGLLFIVSVITHTDTPTVQTVQCNVVRSTK